jgi:hypothetical protein
MYTGLPFVPVLLVSPDTDNQDNSATQEEKKKRKDTEINIGSPDILYTRYLQEKKEGKNKTVRS